MPRAESRSRNRTGWRNGVYAEIRGWTQAQGGLSIQRMCELAQVSGAGFYRHWEQKASSEAEMALRDAVQRAAIGHRYYGYRRIQRVLEREGFVVGIKKVRRLMRDDNLLAVRRRKFVRTTNADHRFRVHPNLAAIWN